MTITIILLTSRMFVFLSDSSKNDQTRLIGNTKYKQTKKTMSINCKADCHAKKQ